MYFPYVLVNGVLVDAPVTLTPPECIPYRQAFAPAETVFLEDENDCPCGDPAASVETGTGTCSSCA